MLREQVNLLVVDDDPRNLMALEAVLGPLQQRIFKASSGTEALRLLLQHEFAAIVLDVKMPEMDGFECARLIREREKSARTPIIFLTGMDEGAPPEFHAYEVGAVDYLIKPVEPSILCGKLQVFVELALKTREVQRVAEELRAALRSREDFPAVGSHELRTPITALKFQVRNAIKSWERPGTIENPVAHALAYLRQVQQSVDRLARLSDYLLDLSRLSSSELHLQRTLTDLEEVARAAVLRPSPDGAWPTAPATVQVNGNMHGFWDRTRLEQILANLIDNARKYAPGPLEVELSGEPETVTFSVRDHGPGVKPDEIPRLFARFARAQAPDDTRGFGLGLWIVSQLAEHHGGTVHAEHPEDGGARFVVKLPRGTPPIRSSETPVPQPAPLP